jgi:hypothetical protein
MAWRCCGRMLPVFSSTRWTTRSGRHCWAIAAIHTILHKCRDSAPRSPSLPWRLPVRVSCWHGLPAVMRSSAPRGIEGQHVNGVFVDPFSGRMGSPERMLEAIPFRGGEGGAGQPCGGALELVGSGSNGNGGAGDLQDRCDALARLVCIDLVR